MNLTNRLLLIFIVETIYWVGSRVAIHLFDWTSFEAELIRTALRIATAIIYWQLMKPVILSKTAVLNNARDTVLITGLLLFLSIPLLVGNSGLQPYNALLFAITSFPVAIKEEFLFRGIVQNLLEKKFGAMYAIVITSSLFTVWHFGVVPNSVWEFSQIFFAGILLGLVYVRTGSILMVIVLHGVYDAIFSVTPLLSSPLDENLGFVPLLAAVGFVYFWACFGKGGYYLKYPVQNPQQAE
jgi:membrane protease YdiL (CAAX protease family)